MRSEHFPRDDTNGNADNIKVEGATDDPQADESASDASDEDNIREIVQCDKLDLNSGEATPTSLRTEKTGEKYNDSDHEANDDNEGEKNDLADIVDEQVNGEEFVAAWILANFPDIMSEAELKSQVAELANSSATGETNADPTTLPCPTDRERCLCEECSASIAAFVCKDCALALCFRCTDAIHIIPSLSTHSIRFGRVNQAPEPQQELSFDAEVPVMPTTRATPESPPCVASTHRLAFSAGTRIFFRAPDSSRWSRELLHGTLTSQEPVTTSSGDKFYYRVLWLRGVEALPNGFFRAALTLPGWDSSDGKDDIGETFWPHQIGVFPTQLGALRAVITAEQIARAKFRRELEGGRIHRWCGFEADYYDDAEAFPTSEVLDEIVAETAATLGNEFGVRLTRQDDTHFYKELAQGTWNLRKWMEAIGRKANLREEAAVPFEHGIATGNSMLEEDTHNKELERSIPTPWAPATRMRYFMIPQHELVFPELVCRQHLRTILEQLLFVYAGFAWRLWGEYVKRHREREELQKREQAACVLQAWTRRIVERKREKERQLLVGMAIGSSMDVLELYRRQQIEARKLYTFLIRQMEERKRKALKRWRVAVGPSNPPPPPALTWHPSHGMKAMLPKLPRMGARRRTVNDKSVAPGTQIIIEDMATYKLFRANHAGPADTSYWVIRTRILAGACPIGPAFREARRLVSRTDFATSVLLQQISVFVCLMEPHELRNMETEATGDSTTGTDWCYERQVRTKYQALCRELQGAETISKRHVELAQQALIEFDAEAANAAAAAMGCSGTKADRKRRASMSLHQQQVEDVAEEAKMKEAHDVLEQKLQLAEQQAAKATLELARLGMMQLEFLYFPIEHDGIPDSNKLIGFLEEQVEPRLRAGKNLYIFSRLGHGRTGLVSALLLGRLYGITVSEALERTQRVHDCQRPGAPRGVNFCSPTTASQLAFVRRTLACSMDAIYVPLVLENSDVGFRSTRVQQRGLLVEPYLQDDGFMVSATGDAQAREREVLEQKRLERIARRESTAAALQQERRKQKYEHKVMEIEDGEQAAREVMTGIYGKIMEDSGCDGL